MPWNTKDLERELLQLRGDHDALLRRFEKLQYRFDDLKDRMDRHIAYYPPPPYQPGHKTVKQAMRELAAKDDAELEATRKWAQETSEAG